MRSLILVFMILGLTGGFRLEGGHGKPSRMAGRDKCLVFAIAFSPDGQQVGSGDGSGKITFRALDSVEVKSSHPLHEGKICSIEFSRIGQFLATARADGKVVIFGIREMKIRRVIDAGDSQGFARLSPDGKSVATATKLFFTLGDVKLWDVGSRGKITSAISPIWSQSETRHPPGSRPIYSHAISSFFAPLRECPFTRGKFLNRLVLSSRRSRTDWRFCREEDLTQRREGAKGRSAADRP
ncbi:WD40 repeat domain-containing protein [Lignipirellula cremea]|uniref:WD domain, G-beta repeat n=1 Tax=Lignipirellula cremea TaxID=2528010 RepID=A0A518DMC6_9BACT|nr:WD40 repeat domain-containing protein [Lignipirellula cremea]QDU92971.1 WD domain, G-beta repeat [Lignipirellula cremea]